MRLTIGIWENDCYDYKLGKLEAIVAKRPKCYLKIYEKGYKFTVAGINSKVILNACEYYVKQGYFNKYGKDGEIIEKVFVDSVEDCFIKNVEIGSNLSKKLTHKYDNKQKTINYVDDKGNHDVVNNLFAIHLEDAPFKLSDKVTDEDVLEIISGNSRFSEQFI